MMAKAAEFFTEEEKARIREAVAEAESRTSGEIVPLVVDEAYDYPRADIIGAGFFSLGAASLISWLFFHASLWGFLPFFLGLYLPCKFLIRALPGLRRRLIHPAEISAEVEEKALVSFLEHNLHRTRDATGVLILISLFERRVQVLADKGINDAVPPNTWDEIVAIITDGLRTGKACTALCTAITRCGDLLEGKFPVRPDDRNELPDLIV